MKNKITKSISLTLCVLLSAALMSACSDDTQLSDKEILSNNYTRSTDVEETYNYSDGATDAPSTYTTYSSEITDFELKLFRNYYKNRNDSSGSFVTAPVNTALQLGLAANGASGDTQKEIINALGDDLTLDIINQCSSYFKSRIQSVANESSDKIDELTGKPITSDSTSYVKLTNSFVFNDISDVKTKFLQSNADYYGSDIFRIDFTDENAVLKLNGYLNDYAENAFDSLSSNDSMFSVTASDICDTWLNAYAQTDITEGTFNSSTGETTVNFMTSNESYMQTSSASGIVKYMSKTPLKLVLVMPEENTTLDEYITNFTNLEYTKLLKSIDITKKATAKIPEFSISSGSSAEEITTDATSSGLYTLFTDDAAFSSLTNSNSFLFNNMYEIFPKVTVNAAGIGGKEANEASKVLSKRTTELDEIDTAIEFNRPFIFMVIDNESSIPLYIGTVDITE